MDPASPNCILRNSERKLKAISHQRSAWKFSDILSRSSEQLCQWFNLSDISDNAHTRGTLYLTAAKGMRDKPNSEKAHRLAIAVYSMSAILILRLVFTLIPWCPSRSDRILVQHHDPH